MDACSGSLNPVPHACSQDKAVLLANHAQLGGVVEVIRVRASGSAGDVRTSAQAASTATESALAAFDDLAPAGVGDGGEDSDS